MREYLEKSAVNNYKEVYKFFCKQVTENSSDPYQEVLDNYDRLASLMREYEQPKDLKIDYMKMATNIVSLHIGTAMEKCYSWSYEEFYDHFEQVYCFMNYWKGVLIDKGYNFED